MRHHRWHITEDDLPLELEALGYSFDEHMRVIDESPLGILLTALLDAEG